MKFAGHTEAVEDVAFNPQHDHELCSVGDDKSLRFWGESSAEGGLDAKHFHSKRLKCDALHVRVL